MLSIAAMRGLTNASWDVTKAAYLAAVIGMAAAANGAITPVAPDSGLCAEDLVVRMDQANETRDRSLGHFSVVRHYTLRSEKGRVARMEARIEFHRESGKRFVILADDNGGGIFHHVLEKVIQAEVQDVGREDNAISPANYNFRLLGEEVRDGHKCYVVQLEPKRKSKYLLEGRAWIDADEYALVRVEGRTASPVSFWTGRPYIVQCYRKIGNYWLASDNDSVTNAKFVGRTELTINSSDYSLPGLNETQVAEKLRAPMHAETVD